MQPDWHRHPSDTGYRCYVNHVRNASLADRLPNCLNLPLRRLAIHTKYDRHHAKSTKIIHPIANDTGFH